MGMTELSRPYLFCRHNWATLGEKTYSKAQPFYCITKLSKVLQLDIFATINGAYLDSCYNANTY